MTPAFGGRYSIQLSYGRLELIVIREAIAASGRSANGRAVLTPLRGFPGPSLPARAFVPRNATLSGLALLRNRGLPS